MSASAGGARNDCYERLINQKVSQEIKIRGSMQGSVAVSAAAVGGGGRVSRRRGRRRRRGVWPI